LVNDLAEALAFIVVDRYIGLKFLDLAQLNITLEAADLLLLPGILQLKLPIVLFQLLDHYNVV
jgi:hypothetical protein